MKTYTFTIFGHTFTFKFGKGKNTTENLPTEEIKMEEKDKTAWPTFNPVYHGPYASTVNEPDVPYAPTFYSCCVEYIDSQKGKLAESTLKGYRNIIDNHLDVIMENVTIDEINENWIQEAFNHEIARGLSEKTLKGYRSFILKVLAVYRPDLKPEIRITKEVQE